MTLHDSARGTARLWGPRRCSQDHGSLTWVGPVSGDCAASSFPCSHDKGGADRLDLSPVVVAGTRQAGPSGVLSSWRRERRSHAPRVRAAHHKDNVTPEVNLLPRACSSSSTRIITPSFRGRHRDISPGGWKVQLDGETCRRSAAMQLRHCSTWTNFTIVWASPPDDDAERLTLDERRPADDQ